MQDTLPAQLPRVSTGISGLDDILGGGFPQGRFYLVHGDPGAGKTTVALHFLREGVLKGEKCVYVTLSETGDELADVARSHGWNLDSVSLFDLSRVENQLAGDAENTLFHPSEVELAETTRAIMDCIDEVKPTRVVLDSLSEMRLLAQSSLRYRRQILTLKQFFSRRTATVLLLDDRTSAPTDLQLESLAHGVIEMEQVAPGYGAERRRLRVVKMRGTRYRGGFHDFVIRTGGIAVFPRLIAAEHHLPFLRGALTSGLPELDALLGGGIERGTSTLLLGPAGSGKSAVATAYAKSVADGGGKAALFAFDEGRETLLARARSLGMDLSAHVASGAFAVQQIDPAEMSTGEFIDQVRTAVEGGATLIIIDSINGFANAMLEERFLTTHLHELLSYLGQRGVATMLLFAQHGMFAGAQPTAEVSYLADTVLMLRYFEAGGQIHKAISVLKKRTGSHETTIRELIFGPEGVRVGKVLREFRGILTGVPEQDERVSGAAEQ